MGFKGARVQSLLPAGHPYASTCSLGQGFAWNGTPYRSLSQVARAITGTHWNGPRFFG